MHIKKTHKNNNVSKENMQCLYLQRRLIDILTIVTICNQIANKYQGDP